MAVMQYRRIKQPGSVISLTANLAKRHRRLLVDHVECLRSAVRQIKDAHPFDIAAMVILPITSTASGRYRRTIAIFRRDGR